MRSWRLFAFLALAAVAVAQTDAPPERTRSDAPDELPPIDNTGELPEPRGRVDVAFVGASAFPEPRLREAVARAITTIEQYGLDEPNAFDAAYFLENFYRSNGYTQVTVEHRIAGSTRLVLTVREGPLTSVGPIEIRGNGAFPTAEVERYLLGPTRERFPRVREVTALPFVEADVNKGVDFVRRLYASSGYLDAEIEDPLIRYNADRTSAAITLRVREGRQYRFGRLGFAGASPFDEATLAEVVRRDTQDIFTPGRLAAAERALTDFHRKRGYFTAEVTAEGDPADANRAGEVPVTFNLAAGPLYRFNGIVVSGTQDVRPDFVRKRLRRLEGQVYSPEAIDRRYRELIDTGLFRTLSITPEAVEGDRVRLNVTVEEARPKEFGVGIGYATFDGGIVSFTYTDRNLFRTGRPFTTSIEATQRGVTGEVLYRNPWLFESDYELRLRLYALQRRLVGYSKQEFGFRPELARKITRNWEVSAFVLAKSVLLQDVLIEPVSEVGREDYAYASIGVSQTLDFRNNPTVPTRGFIASTTLDLAPDGLGSIAFARAVGRFTYYQPIIGKSSLALGARAGVIGSLNDNGIPIDERFFNGGATTVRSYPELNLGPRDRAGYPLGGEAFTVFNAEFTFPIWGDLMGATFVDAGNVIPRAADFGLSGMRYGVGAGLRYNLPIGAIRFDYGYNPAPGPGDAQGAFHFAVGVAF